MLLVMLGLCFAYYMLKPVPGMLQHKEAWYRRIRYTRQDRPFQYWSVVVYCTLVGLLSYAATLVLLIRALS